MGNPFYSLPFELGKSEVKNVVLQIGDEVCAFISTPERMTMASVDKESKPCFLIEDETLFFVIQVANIKGQKRMYGRLLLYLHQHMGSIWEV